MTDPIRITTADEIPAGEAYVVEGDLVGLEGPISIFHTDDDQWYAIDDTCTHQTASLADGWLEADEIECPVHAARFCLKSGEALCMPATKPVGVHTVEIRDGEVWVTPGTQLSV